MKKLNRLFLSKKLKTSLLFFFFCTTLLAQQESKYWHFGTNAGVVFSGGTGTPSALLGTQVSSMNTREGCSSISDANGNLLFYTDGVTVYDKTNTPMPLGTGLYGDASSSQSALIVPKPGNGGRYYYIFTTYREGVNTSFHYSVVDMQAIGNGSGANPILGDVVSTLKNVNLYNNGQVYEKLTAYKRPDGDYWVIAHSNTSNDFIEYKVTSSTSPWTPSQTLIPIGTGASSLNYLGCLKFSKDGNKLAMAMWGSNKVEVYDFNVSTGAITNAIALTDNTYLKNAYGVEFSPSGRYLYTTASSSITPISDTYLSQFDLQASNILASRQTIDNYRDSTGRGFGTLQLGPDCKIYVARDGKTSLACIQNPDIGGTSCAYNATAVSLAGKTCQLGLPNFVANFVCKGSCDYFKLEANDTNCCQAGIVRTMAGGPNVIKVKFIITGGVAQGYTSNCPSGVPSSTGVAGFASRTVVFPSCNMQFFTTSLQSTTASGTMVASYTVYFANGDSCTYKTNVVGCPRAPKTNCDRLTVYPYVYTGLDLSGRTFRVFNTKQPSSPICKILISLTPMPSTNNWQGGGLKHKSYGSILQQPTPGTYFAAPYQVIPSGTGSPWLNFSPNTSHYVQFNLGVDFTIGWVGTVNLKVIHCDGDTCSLSYTNWIAAPSSTQQQFTTVLKQNDSLFAVSLSLGLPTVKNKTIKWLGVEVTKDNSEIFSITGGRYETEKKIDTSKLPLMSSEQSANFALFELEDNMKLDGTASQLPINMVFKGKRPTLHLTGYDENGNEVISDTFTVKKNVAGVYQMVKPVEGKIGLIAYPNPSASDVTFSYFIEDASEVEFTVFDISGSFINSYSLGKKSAGSYEFKIDNSSLAAGTYIVKMHTEKYDKSIIMQVAK